MIQVGFVTKKSQKQAAYASVLSDFFCNNTRVACKTLSSALKIIF